MLEIEIDKDLKAAMKCKDTLTVRTLRLLKDAFSTARNEKNAKPFTERTALQILQKNIKNRQEVAELYKDSKIFAETELAEATVLLKYLPQEISDLQLRSIVAEVIHVMKPTKKDMGLVMLKVNQIIGDNNKIANNAKVAGLVKDLLN